MPGSRDSNGPAGPADNPRSFDSPHPGKQDARKLRYTGQLSGDQYYRRRGAAVRRADGRRGTARSDDTLGASAARILAAFVSQTALLTAVLYYFGWSRVLTTYDYFGVDVSVLDFSAPDYVLRSVSTAFPLLVAAGLLVLAALMQDSRLRPKLEANPQFTKQLGWILVIAGAGLALTGLALALVITTSEGPALPGPVILMIGFAAAFYGVVLLNRYAPGSGTRYLMVAVTLALLPLFLLVNSYASFEGIRVAQRLQAGLLTDPNVIVYSSGDLSLSGPGITEYPLAPSGAYRFRYSGLRLLVSAADRYFLLPAKWHRGNGSLIILPFTPPGINIRVEFQAPS